MKVSMRAARALQAALAISSLAVMTPPAHALDLPQMPSLDALKDYHPKVPLRVYTSDGALIGEFGDQNRSPVKIRDVPALMKKAILAAEDDRFYQHSGVDFIGVARAVVADVISGGKRQGASTITMQVARNFYLSNEKSFSRKINEMMLAMEIERQFSKDQILEFYINQIYLGQRAYGFEAAAETYFGKHLNQLNLGEMAVLAGLPKGPSVYNPIANLPRAKQRQEWILGRMRTLGYINDAQYRQAVATPLHVRRGAFVDVNADHIAELVREAMYAKYGDSIYTSGMKVYTTLRKSDQAAADHALLDGVTAYDHRHGYRGPEGYFKLPEQFDLSALDSKLGSVGTVQGLQPAVVLSASSHRVDAYIGGGQTVHIAGSGLAFVHKALAGSASHPIRRGALVRVARRGKGWEITELPQVQAALVALDPRTGAVRAMVGGLDYAHNRLNHVTQAWRQPGSSFKPFIYSAALEKGFTPASTFEDTPLSLPNGSGGVWQPKNYEGDYGGPMRLRVALAHSRNLPTIRLLMAETPQYAQEYITRFGFSKDKHPAYLTLALGAGSATPMQMATAYSVFANGGSLVTPYFMEKIVDAQGRVLSQWHPAAPRRVIDPRNAFIMSSMMQDVVKYGTGAAVAKLGRHDLAGKTGTTNEQDDGWFAGFNPNLVAVSWMGFDKPQPLGHGETGANTALPIWMNFMGQALRNTPDRPLSPPAGVVTARIDRTTGLLASSADSVPEYFLREHLPQPGATAVAAAPVAAPAGASPVPGSPSAPVIQVPGLPVPAASVQPSAAPAQPNPGAPRSFQWLSN